MAITSKNYVENVLRTESIDFDAIIKRLSDKDIIRLLHADMGICTESGELTDALKKFIFYGKEVDRINVIEEAGDLMWYIGLLVDALGITLDEVMTKNIAKLSTRYPDKFTVRAALNRDLESERGVLEEK